MARGIKNKHGKRLRSAKAAHLYSIKGKGQLERLNARMNDPTYQMKSEYSLPVNAYLEPDNPLAVFPQVKKPDILDFRCHKIQGGAVAAIGSTRKLPGTNRKLAKYETVIKTREEIDAEEAEQTTNMEEEDAAVVIKSELATK